MNPRLRLAVVKPDWGIRGGFELVVDRLVDHCRRLGHDVSVLAFDAWKSDRRPFGIPIDAAWDAAPQFFTYLAQLESARRLDTRRADVVISTQPPSFVVDHPRHLSVFFHHARVFYDLSQYAQKAGLVPSAAHAEACAAIRRIDTEAIAAVRHVAAGSETVAQRLADYSSRRADVSVFHAGPSLDDPWVSEPLGGGHHALCVSRHDFPKRTELFVQASRLVPHIAAVSVGPGGRLGWIRQLAGRLATGALDPSDDSDELWCSDVPWVDPDGTRSDEMSNLHIAGAVSTAALVSYYREALCVVAPALLEDYGLTAIEAMRYGKPVIVCSDGGHLCQLVEDGVTGLVVEPSGGAIADAIAQLEANPGLAAELGANGRDFARQFTWERAFAEFDHALEETLA